jgi:hypothetical protein
MYFDTSPFIKLRILSAITQPFKHPANYSMKYGNTIPVIFGNHYGASGFGISASWEGYDLTQLTFLPITIH